MRRFYSAAMFMQCHQFRIYCPEGETYDIKHQADTRTAVQSTAAAATAQDCGFGRALIVDQQQRVQTVQPLQRTANGIMTEIKFDCYGQNAF